MFIRKLHGEEKSPNRVRCNEVQMSQRRQCDFKRSIQVYHFYTLLTTFLPLLYFIYASYPVKSFHCFSPECGRILHIYFTSLQPLLYAYQQYSHWTLSCFPSKITGASSTTDACPEKLASHLMFTMLHRMVEFGRRWEVAKDKSINQEWEAMGIAKVKEKKKKEAITNVTRLLYSCPKYSCPEISKNVLVSKTLSIQFYCFILLFCLSPTSIRVQQF